MLVLIDVVRVVPRPERLQIVHEPLGSFIHRRRESIQDFVAVENGCCCASHRSPLRIFHDCHRPSKEVLRGCSWDEAFEVAWRWSIHKPRVLLEEHLSRQIGVSNHDSRYAHEQLHVEDLAKLLDPHREHLIEIALILKERHGGSHKWERARSREPDNLLLVVDFVIFLSKTALVASNHHADDAYRCVRESIHELAEVHHHD
mmetsp:Transcript_5735/g.14657  ORF Transcript_5735/g.14657 Transcript_5735/m.14657 type:complete len:202 (+) Transcript_5735:2947-3552(+)